MFGKIVAFYLHTREIIYILSDLLTMREVALYVVRNGLLEHILPVRNRFRPYSQLTQ
jgi:hypothetical protein